MKYLILILIFASCQKPSHYTCECKAQSRGLKQDYDISSKTLSDATFQCTQEENQWKRTQPDGTCMILTQ